MTDLLEYVVDANIAIKQFINDPLTEENNQ